MLRIFTVALFLALPAMSAGAQDLQKGLAAAKRGDHVAAYREWKPLAIQGHPRAQLYIGLSHQYGKGVTKDLGIAVQWFQSAADGGDVDAQYRLGVLLTKGEGVRKDYTRAAAMFRRAALQGHVKAQAFLGALYGDGRGVIEDLETGYMWLDIASHKGSKEHQATRDKMGRFLSRSQRQRARYRARICWATKYEKCD
ncbi:MAG TPA: tetratricopeptide repeat protein [Gammaproteobacteria bacterium]|nr:tetratricopeptide repeat protein [Gammaproteobacteria bacterium]